MHMRVTDIDRYLELRMRRQKRLAEEMRASTLTTTSPTPDAGPSTSSDPAGSGTKSPPPISSGNKRAKPRVEQWGLTVTPDGQRMELTDTTRHEHAPILTEDHNDGRPARPSTSATVPSANTCTPSRPDRSKHSHPESPST